MSFLLVKTVYMATRFTEVSTSRNKSKRSRPFVAGCAINTHPCCTLSQAVKARRLLLSTADTQGLPDGTNWRLATSTSWSKSVQLEGQDSLALNQTRQTCSDPECQQSNNYQIWMAPISPISLSLDGLYKLSFWIGFCKVLKKCGNIWESKIRDYSSHWVVIPGNIVLATALSSRVSTHNYTKLSPPSLHHLTHEAMYHTLPAFWDKCVRGTHQSLGIPFLPSWGPAVWHPVPWSRRVPCRSDLQQEDGPLPGKWQPYRYHTVSQVYVAIVHSNITQSSKEFIGPEMTGFRCCIFHGNWGAEIVLTHNISVFDSTSTNYFTSRLLCSLPAMHMH